MREGPPEAAGRRWIREPLIGFGALAVLLFGVHALVGPGAAVEEPAIQRRLDVPSKVAAARPDLVARWIDDEVAFREGLALGLDRGDPVVRDRVIERYVGDALANVDPPDPTEAQLAELLSAHRERYRTGVRLDFEQVFISKRRHADAATLAASVLTALQDGADAKRTQGRYSAGKRFTLGRVAGTFGRTFAEAVAELEPGVWRDVEVESGHHLVRINRRDAGGKVPALREIRRRVRRDFIEADRRAHRDALVDRLRDQFEVERPS